MKHFLFRGHKVCYVEAGEGPPLVFLHNGGNDHRTWDFQIAHFRESYRVFALDHLGFGESDKPRIDYSLPLYSEMLRAFIDELGLAPVSLVANCLGGAMALDYTLKSPEKVRRLVLFHVATEKTLLSGPLAPTYLSYSRHHWLRDLYVAYLAIRGMSRSQTDVALRGQYGDNDGNDPEFAEYIHRLYNKKGQLRSLYNLLSNWESFRVLDEFTKPANFPPTCLFWGKSNHILAVQAGEELARRLRPDRMEMVEGCGHLVMRERAAEVNGTIEGFLAATEAPPMLIPCEAVKGGK